MSRYSLSFDKVVKTNLPNNQKSIDILGSVIGQMSDGMWENSPYMEGYWHFVNTCKDYSKDSVEDGNIYIADRPWDYEGRYSINNRFYGMSEQEVKTFFAKKIKKITNEELKDNYIGEKRKQFYAIYGLEVNEYYVCHTSKIKERNLAEKQLQEYLTNHPYKSKVFNEKNDTVLRYLTRNNNTPITVADAVRAYNTLMN